MAKLCILSCGDFYPEVAAAVKAEGWKDVTVAAFPPDCARPPLDWNTVRSRVPADCTEILLVGNSCLQKLTRPPRELPHVKILALQACFDLVAPADLVRDKIADGSYLMTPSWLNGWESRMRARGFSRSSAGEFFRDFAHELVLLDTRPVGDGDIRLAEMSRAVGLPARRIPLGLDVVREHLRREVAEWRAQAEPAQDQRLHADADLAAALDLMARLTAAGEEPEVLEEICAVFAMLFAPASLVCFPVERDEVKAVEGAAEPAFEEARRLSGAYAWTASGRGFLVRLCRGEQTLGIVFADELAFPEYKERYLSMALALGHVAALALDGARSRRILLEAEKMASLSILVAGVAHEVNTPVGVCLATASTMELQLKSVAEKFSARTMTQSDLNRYLDAASSEVHLIVGNLERMGRIIESFRAAAAERVRPAKKVFRLRTVIEQSVAALGQGGLGDALCVQIHCDADLAIESSAGDWSTIFTNLYSNALRHAFKGRARATVTITARVDGGDLLVDFEDDGLGVSPEVRKHIFDPFFTTDMQRGMGLGLHLVYNLVRQCLKGSIACESTQDVGTRFRIVVPK